MAPSKPFAVLLLVLAVAGAARAATPKTVADAVIANKNKGLGILLEAVLAADKSILAALSDPKLVATVFAPTDDAFARLLRELDVSKSDLLHDKALLNKVLAYHVVPGVAAKAKDLKRRQTVQTLLKGSAGKLTIRKLTNGVVRLFTSSGIGGSAKVEVADVKAGKTIIHVINKVLIPK